MYSDSGVVLGKIWGPKVVWHIVKIFLKIHWNKKKVKQSVKIKNKQRIFKIDIIYNIGLGYAQHVTIRSMLPRPKTIYLKGN